MDIGVSVTGIGIDDDQIAYHTRELLKTIREDADPYARFETQNTDTDSKGLGITLGQIALMLVSGGTVSKFVQAAFAFLGRHRKLEIELQKAASKKMKLKWDYIDSHGEEKAIALVKAFLTEGT